MEAEAAAAAAAVGAAQQTSSNSLGRDVCPVARETLMYNI